MKTPDDLFGIGVNDFHERVLDNGSRCVLHRSADLSGDFLRMYNECTEQDPKQ
jgi:hypothetical protein